jgi:hypothetical protein
MTKEQYEGELNYRIAMNIADNMLKKGLITKREHVKMSRFFLEKYKPILSSLTA